MTYKYLKKLKNHRQHGNISRIRIFGVIHDRILT
jgi:hypothetical protein